MRLLTTVIVGFLSLLLFVSCSNEDEDKNDPTTTVKQYIEHWNNKQFSSMYDMLSDETKEQYAPADFIERYEKIYNDLNVTNLDIDYTPIETDDLDSLLEERHVQFPINVSMDSIAGPINFPSQLELNLITVDEDEMIEEWFVNWNTTLIFPELIDNAKIKLDKISSRRGDILDRNRMPLAINDTAFEVGIVPEQFVNEDNEKQQIAQLLNMNIEAINKILGAAWVEPHHFVPIKEISKQQEQTLNDLKNIPSVSVQETTGRHYPLGEAAAHLTGFIGQITAEELENLDEQERSKYKETDLIGKRGLEQLFEKRLKGEDGVKLAIVKDNGQEVELAEKQVQHGETIQLTIDITTQEHIFSSLKESTGTAVAIHPKTGETLALVSSPSFDPNEFTYGISTAKWEQLLNNEHQPLFNRFTATYAPGSVLKPVTAAIGLQNGIITADETLEIDGLEWSKDSWNKTKISRVSATDEPVDLHDAIVRSDNIYFAMKSLDIGGKAFVEGLKQFGFEESIPIKYPFNQSKVSNSGHLNDEILLANTSYGQGEIEMSVLHLAATYTPFLNDGHLLAPTLLLDEPTPHIWRENVIDKNAAQMMAEFLRDVVTEGTGQIANKEDLDISGKTGTVELKLTYESEENHQNGWFVGYPTKEQDILIAMMMERIEDTGSSIVAETVADLLITLQK